MTFRPAIAAAFFCIFSLTLLSCGRKGAPTIPRTQAFSSPEITGVVVRPDSVILAWRFPERDEDRISGFEVLGSGDGGSERLGSAGPRERTFAYPDGGSSRPSYRIRALDLVGAPLSESGTVMITAGSPPPSPAGAGYTLRGDSAVLSWRGSGDAEMFNVYKRSVPGDYGPLPLNRTALDQNQFRDRISLQETVAYRIRSVSGNFVMRESLPSAEIIIDPLTFVPSQPVNLGYFLSSRGVMIYWRESSEPWVTGYRIYRRSGTGDYELMDETTVPVSIDHDQGETSRSYRVTAVGPLLESPPAEISGIFFTLPGESDPQSPGD